MRKNIVFGAAMLGTAIAFLAAPAANATEEHASIGFINNPAKPGETVTIIGQCTAPGFIKTKLESHGAFEPTEIYLRDNGTGVKDDIYVNTEVAKDAKPGVYEVSYQCGKYRPHTKFTVLDKDGKKPAPTTTSAPKPTKPAAKPTQTTPPAQPAGQVQVKPKGAADTGEGEVQAAPTQQSSGPGTGVFVIGGAALLAAGGAGAFAVRKLRKQG